MSAFDFFFSFYGLVLGLSVAVIATGVATTIQHRKKIQVGSLTPLLAVFVLMDIASFWENAWDYYGDLPFSYGMLVIALAIALVYFVAASLVFPHAIEDGASLDDHFWANKKIVVLLILVANFAAAGTGMAANLDNPSNMLWGALSVLLYAPFVIPLALARKARLAKVMMWIMIGLYTLLTFTSLINATSMSQTPDAGSPEAAAPVPLPAPSVAPAKPVN